MKILFVNPSLRHYFYGSKYDHFINEVARQTECKLAGSGYPDYVKHTSLDDLINQVYGNDEPDWVFGHNMPARKFNRHYKLARWTGDIHVTTDKMIASANAVLTALFMRVQYTPYIWPSLSRFRACFGKPIAWWTSSGNCLKPEKNYVLKRLKIPCFFLPWSVEPSVFRPSPQKKYDVSLIGSVGGFYPLRVAISQQLPRLARKKRWRFLFRRPPNTIEFRHNINLILKNAELRKKWLVGEDYARAVAESKILIFGSSVLRYPIMKYFEGMMSGTLVMADKPYHAEDLHFKSGWNFVEINVQNWQQTLAYYLEDDQLRETIARRGYETALKYHTHQVRAKEFITMLASVK